MSLRSTRIAAVAAGATILVGFGSFGAVAAGLIDSGDIRNNTIQSVDIQNGEVTKADVAKDAVGGAEVLDGSLEVRDLSDYAQSKLKGQDGKDGVVNLEADGPYPGYTDLGTMTDQGDNSDDLVPADALRHTVWVQCAPGKAALGGGFTLAADNTQAAAEAINVLESAPTQIKDGKETYAQIEGDEAGSFLPNAWKVEVVNNGTAAQVVRPWVTCATIAK